jgi:hypothetical protein
MVLITKDGDTLLSSPNLIQILAEARDVFDGTSRMHYRHGLSRDYEAIRMVWILCGTASLRKIDQSELGERFLDCVIMEGIDDELENEVLRRVVRRANKSMSVEADGTVESQFEPEMARAMAMTGGYVEWVRQQPAEAMDRIVVSERVLEKIALFGKFVAYMRARPSRNQDETAEREFGARLASQFMRLAKCLAFVMNRQEVDDLVLGRTRRVALDTARGQTLEMVQELFAASREGREAGAIRLAVNLTEHRTISLLKFLRGIEVVEKPFRPELGSGVHGRPRWRLTKKLEALYGEVVQ